MIVDIVLWEVYEEVGLDRCFVIVRGVLLIVYVVVSGFDVMIVIVIWSGVGIVGVVDFVEVVMV